MALGSAAKLAATRWTWVHLARAQAACGRLDAAVSAYASARRAPGESATRHVVLEPVQLLMDHDRVDEALALAATATGLPEAADRLAVAAHVDARGHGEAAAGLLVSIDRSRLGEASCRRFDRIASSVLSGPTADPGLRRDELAVAAVDAGPRRDELAVAAVDAGPSHVARRAVRYLLATRTAREASVLLGHRVEALGSGSRADLCRALAAEGQLGDALAAAAAGPSDDPWFERFTAARDDEVRTLREGLTYLMGAPAGPAHEPRGLHGLYLARTSLPSVVTGYTTRTQGLLEAMGRIGLSVEVATSPGFATGEAGPLDHVGPVTYRRIPGLAGTPRTLAAKVTATADALDDTVISTRPGIVHAASNWRIGYPAALIARRHGLPFVYEVRGLWELSRASREPAWDRSEGFELEVRLETEVALAGDRVLTISSSLVPELVRRGVPDERIVVVPNGVDTTRFGPRGRDQELEAQLGLQGHRVVGFAGSMANYEGLEDLVLAVSELVGRTERSFRVLLVGDGDEAVSLRRTVTQLGLDDAFRFTGRVPHADVERYLSLFDVAPFPRRPVAVSELVSPLKPLESMATGAAVVVSDVAALAEIVTDDVTGWHFAKGDVGDLTRVLARAIDDVGACRRVTDAARVWVERERSWDVVAHRVRDLYRELGVEVDRAPAG